MTKTKAQPAVLTEWPGFWKGKQPCWVVVGCSSYNYKKCGAYLHPEKACWEQENTQCEQVLGLGRNCQQCAVYERFHTA